MSRFLTKGKFFTTEHIWFEDSLEGQWENRGGYDRIIFHGIDVIPDKLSSINCVSSSQETLISDLSKDDETLWKLTSKTVRNEINRSKRENVEIRVSKGKDISDNLLDEFARMYRAMYEEKGLLGRSLPVNELRVYASNGALVITSAMINGTTVVFHSYMTDGYHSRLLHSCSEFRAADNTMRNAIGRANKYLHWNDWLYLKKIGIIEYDWGGISSYECPNGIDKFKLSFGGKHKKYYHLVCTVSLRARIFDTIRKFCKKLKMFRLKSYYA